MPSFNSRMCCKPAVNEMLSFLHRNSKGLCECWWLNIVIRSMDTCLCFLPVRGGYLAEDGFRVLVVEVRFRVAEDRFEFFVIGFPGDDSRVGLSEVKVGHSIANIGNENLS